MRRAQIFILGTGGALAAIGYLLVALNKDSLGAVSLTTYIGIIVMAVAMKLSGYLITVPRHAIEGKQYGDVMDWAMLLFVWPSYVTPLIVLPLIIGNTGLIFALFAAGIGLFAFIATWGLKISADRLRGRRRHAKWFYFIPSFLYSVPALIIGWFVVSKFASDLTILRLANYGGLLIGAFFSFYCIKLALFDLFAWDVRRYQLMDFLPLVTVLVIVVVIAEIALPLFLGKAEQVYLLYSLSIFALACAQVLGVLSVTRRAKF